MSHTVLYVSHKLHCVAAGAILTGPGMEPFLVIFGHVLTTVAPEGSEPEAIRAARMASGVKNQKAKICFGTKISFFLYFIQVAPAALLNQTVARLCTSSKGH